MGVTEGFPSLTDKPLPTVHVWVQAVPIASFCDLWRFTDRKGLTCLKGFMKAKDPETSNTKGLKVVEVLQLYGEFVTNCDTCCEPPFLCIVLKVTLGLPGP